MYPAVPHPRAGGLSAISYGSEAGPSLQDPFRLAQIVAQIRPANSGLDVTGAITCDAGRIQQWIEGPEAAVAMLWDRIRLDARHRIHWASPPSVVTARHFPGSPMKLAMTTANLTRLAPWMIEDVVRLPDGLTGYPEGPWRDALADAAPTCTLRQLDPAYRDGASRLAQARAAALADGLTNTDPLIARGYLDTLLRQIGLSETAALVQAVLDQVQASWMAGLISAWQRQLAVTMLQSALRLRLDVAESPQTLGTALVSSLPGTPDMCGVMLKVALLRRAGWSVRLLLPQSIEEILLVAQGLDPDLIVLAGSRLSARPAELAMLTSLMPALAATAPAPVILGGKLAEAEPQRLLQRGATAVCGALPWIATIAADLAPAALQDAPAHRPAHDTQAAADHALAAFLAATRARASRDERNRA